MQEHFQLPQEDLPIPQSTLFVTQDECNQAAVRWAPSGIGFIVLNEHSFSKVVLPRYLLHSNYSSFVRKVAPSLPSSTCTTFARSGRPTTRATSSISASTASKGTSWPRSSANPRRRGKLAIRTRTFRVRIRRKQFGVLKMIHLGTLKVYGQPSKNESISYVGNNNFQEIFELSNFFDKLIKVLAT